MDGHLFRSKQPILIALEEQLSESMTCHGTLLSQYEQGYGEAGVVKSIATLRRRRVTTYPLEVPKVWSGSASRGEKVTRLLLKLYRPPRTHSMGEKGDPVRPAVVFEAFSRLAVASQ